MGVLGALVAQCSERSLFSSEVAGSIVSENVVNVSGSQCFTPVKGINEHSAESRGFSPEALRFPPTRKLTG